MSSPVPICDQTKVREYGTDDLDQWLAIVSPFMAIPSSHPKNNVAVKTLPQP